MHRDLHRRQQNTKKYEPFLWEVIEQTWCCHILTSDWLLWQVECPAVTPEAVLKASGHVDRFTDFMVTDAKTGDCHRADHLLKAALEAFLEDPKNSPAPEKKVVRLKFPHLLSLIRGRMPLFRYGQMLRGLLGGLCGGFNIATPCFPCAPCFPAGAKGCLRRFRRSDAAYQLHACEPCAAM